VVEVVNPSHYIRFGDDLLIIFNLIIM